MSEFRELRVYMLLIGCVACLISIGITVQAHWEDLCALLSH